MATELSHTPRTDRASLWLRWVCVFLACTSGLAILAKVWGVTSVQNVALWMTIPCTLLLPALAVAAMPSPRWRGENVKLEEAMILGAVGGLLGTVGYDLWRIPFIYVGQLPFYPVEAYGIWLAEARASSTYTHTLGWSYHTLNGISFGIMYGLAMPRRHWIWGVAWAMILESLAICSPFLWIFNMAGNTTGIVAAYTGHIAYGVPLGLVVWKWDGSLAFLKRFKLVRLMIVPATGIAIVATAAAPFLAPADLRTAPPNMHVNDLRLEPAWVRINRGQSVTFINPGDKIAPILIRKTQNIPVPANGEVSIPFAKTGVYQVFVDTKGRLNSMGFQEMTHSSFIMVEPVEQLR